VVFPASCRTEPVAGSTVAASNTGGDLATRLRRDDAIAWSPDGAKIAFRGGECESVYDDCLSVGDVASGAERTVQAYGGGGSSDGFAAVPAWRPDGARLAWTASSTNESTGTSQPVHIREADPAGGSQRIVGKASDRELAYYSTSKALVTGQYNGSSWVILVDLATGARKPFHAGSQAAVSPVRA
jgi:hypothetical protein